MFFIVLLYMDLKTARRSRKMSRKGVKGRKCVRKGGKSVRKGRKGTMKGRKCVKGTRKMRGGSCNCNGVFPLKGGSSGSVSELPIRYYYKQNDFQNDPTYMQTAARLSGGKKQKGGTLNATDIINKFGDSTGVPYSIGILTGSPYTNSSITNQPIGDKYGASNLYLV